jgi:hypothetical protein
VRLADIGKGDCLQFPQDPFAADFGPLRGAPDDLLNSLAEILSFPFIRLALPSLAL